MEELIIPEQPKEIHPLKHMFVSDEISKELHRLGFNEPCFAYYSLSHTGDDYGFYVVGEYTHYRDFYTNYVGHGLSNSELQRNPTGRLKQCFAAPLYQQVIDWLVTRKYYVYALRYDGKWQYKIDDDIAYVDFSAGEGYENRYEALSAGILSALKYIRMNEFIVSNIKL